MATITTLVTDIYNVLQTGEGYTDAIAKWVADDIRHALLRQTSPRVGRSSLRLSGIGTPCKRKLWYSVNKTGTAEPLRPATLNKFIFGDMTESHILGLAMAAGHDVQGMQDQVNVYGIVGHRDCIIDGMLVDVKSASTYGMRKFKDNGLRDDDPFGYLSQLSSYLYGSQDDPLLTEKNKAAFLAVDKQHGNILLDIYDLSDELEKKEAEVKLVKSVVKKKNPPDRPYAEEPDGRSGNMKLCMTCSYCDYKKTCWPNLRTFLYKGGPRYLTKVEREPRDVFEV